MKNFEWIPIKADDVQQGQLFRLSLDKDDDDILRRVFEDGYMSTQPRAYGQCIIGTDDLSLQYCNIGNTVYIQKFS